MWIISRTNFPTSLKIMGHVYKVIFPYQFKERSDLAGQHDAAVCELRIADRDANGPICTSDIVSTLIEEIFHALDCRSGHQIFKDRHPAVRGLTEVTLAFLLDNGMLEIQE